PCDESLGFFHPVLSGSSERESRIFSSVACSISLRDTGLPIVSTRPQEIPSSCLNSGNSLSPSEIAAAVNDDRNCFGIYRRSRKRPSFVQRALVSTAISDSR